MYIEKEKKGRECDTVPYVLRNVGILRIHKNLQNA